MVPDDIIDNLKPHWYVFIIAGIILAVQQVIILIYSAQYIGLDLSSKDTAQSAIQLFHWMNTSTDPMATVFIISQKIGILIVPFVFIGIFLLILKWREDRNQNK